LPLAIIDSYKKLKLNKHYQYTLEKTQQQLQQIPFKEIEQYWYLHKLIETDANRFESRNQRTTRNSIMPVIESLDIFYITKKLRYLCEAANRNDVLNIGYNTQQHELLLQIISPYNNEQYPYIYIFYRFYLMFITADMQQASVYYYELKKFFLPLLMIFTPLTLMVFTPI
jgi:anaerobic selenocysteine-containing dehydrogenase